MNSLLMVGIFVRSFSRCAAGGASGGGPGQDVAALVRETEEANKALVRGDIDKYVALTRHGKDYLLMNPFGGAPTRGFEDTPERREGMKKFFKNGTLEQEVVATWESGDLVVLVTIERVRGEIGGLPSRTGPCASRRSFGVTASSGSSSIATRIRSGNRITVPQAAALSRGTAP